MKPLRANTLSIAKTTFTLAACLLIACTAARADDETKSKTPGANSRDQGVSSSGESDSKGGGDTKSSSQSGSSSSLSKPDQKFIREAAEGGRMEVQMGKLGVQKAQNSQVKQFAQRLVDDHTKANTELKQLASSKGITLPDDSIASASSSDRSKVRDKSDSSGSDTDHSGHGQSKAQMKRLEQLSGTDFDREFVRMAIADHEKDVKEFEKQAQKSRDAEVKLFAQKTAPILREHLREAKSLQGQVGQGAPGLDKSSSTGTDSSSSSKSSGSSSDSSGTSSGTK